MKVTLLEEKKDVYDAYQNIPSMENLNVFQSQFYYDLMSLSKESVPKVLIAEDGNKIVGIVLIQIQNYFSSLLKAFSSRAIISGGPLFNKNENVLSVLLYEYRILFSRKVVYTQIRNLFDVDTYSHIFDKYEFKRINHLNYLTDLNVGIDGIWENVYSKRKNEIRRGIKEGIVVKEIMYENELPKAYEIIQTIYKKAKLPLPNYDYFYNARKIQDGEKIFKVIGGYFDGILVGVMFLLCFNDKVYNWYAASNPDYYKKYPNDIITWEAIKWSSENGYRFFDFGGAGNPAKNYGVREFKKKFGGVEVNFGRYECTHRPFIMKASEFGFKLLQKFK